MWPRYAAKSSPQTNRATREIMSTVVVVTADDRRRRNSTRANEIERLSLFVNHGGGRKVRQKPIDFSRDRYHTQFSAALRTRFSLWWQGRGEFVFFYHRPQKAPCRATFSGFPVRQLLDERPFYDNDWYPSVITKIVITDKPRRLVLW